MHCGKEIALRKLFMFAAFATTAAITYATLTHVGLG
jgi:hypothetical protein